MSEAIASEHPSSSWHRLRSNLGRVLMLPGVGPLIALVAASAFFATQTDKFLTGHNWSLIFQQVVVVGTLAIGQTIIILTAGIDLSNGMVMALGSVLMASLAVEYGVPPVIAILAGFAVDDALWLAQRLIGGAGEAAALYRDAGYAQYRLCDYPHLPHHDDLKLAA